MISTERHPILFMKPCVLVIDDDASIRAALKKVLAESGYRVVLAADGREGTRRLKEQECDLVVLDLDLPKISGWDILDLTAAGCSLLPVVVLTGYSGECVPGALVGADALLEKPPEVGLLLKTIAGLLAEPANKRAERRAQGLAAAPAVAIRGPNFSWLCG